MGAGAHRAYFFPCHGLFGKGGFMDGRGLKEILGNFDL
jgi:hypothetical protein